MLGQSAGIPVALLAVGREPVLVAQVHGGLSRKTRAGRRQTTAGGRPSAGTIAQMTHQIHIGNLNTPIKSSATADPWSTDDAAQ